MVQGSSTLTSRAGPRRWLRALRRLRRAPELLACVRQSAGWRELATAYLGLSAVTYPHEFGTRTGDRLTLESFHDLVTVWIIFFRHEYAVPADARTIVDAGANIGAFSVYAASRASGAQIVALEPFPTTRARLEEHLVRNGLGNRVSCRPWALARSDGLRSMDDAIAPSQSRGLLDPSVSGSGVPVETVTLATLFDREGLDRVDLLKMDIEGGEHEVLHTTPPAVLRRVTCLALEYHPNGSKTALFQVLLASGFELRHDAPVAPDSGVAHFVRPAACK